MSSPLFESIGTPNILQQFNQFRSTFHGDPRAQVQQMLSTGQMSQAQFNQIAKMATQIRRSMK